jgi:hypothetical protein
MAFVGSITVGGAILGAGALGGAASLGSALIGSNAAKEASGIQSQSAANALSLQKQMFDQSQSNYTGAKSAIGDTYQPYLDVGRGATYTLGSMYGIGKDGSTGGQQDFSQFTNSPDYAFAQQQGNLALDRANNAKGLNLSGGALKDAMQFNQGLASQQFGNYYNRLLSLSQIGQNAANGYGSNLASLTSGQANNAQGFSGQMSNSIQGQGQAQASGVVGSANALAGGINGVANSASGAVNNTLLYNAINRSSYAGFGGNMSQGYSENPSSLAQSSMGGGAGGGVWY